ncbi:MAG: potassium channel protein [Vicinamibacteria bacterium]
MKSVPAGYRPTVVALLVVLILVLGGTVGYMLVEGWSLFDSVYMAVITLTTVGYLEIHPLSTAGRLFTMVLLLTGVFSLFYAATSAIRSIVGGELTGQLGRSRMEKKLQALRDHIIICGYGRMGRLVAQEFSQQKIPFVVIERNPDLLANFEVENGLALVGDATHDGTLRRAGIDRAKTLVALAASDADNLFITLSARLMTDDVFIVARAEEEGAEKKLMKAGASRVISPYVIGGQRVAQAVLRPSVVDFIELATRSDYMALQIEETPVGKGSSLCGQALKEAALRQSLGLIVVAIKRADGRMEFNPAPETTIAEGDILITLGPKHRQDQLQTLAT